MRIDFHTHIFPKEIRENRQKLFSSEPAFKLLYRKPKSKLTGGRELLSAMDDQEIDTSVVFGFPWKNPETFRRHNDYILDCIARYRSRFAGFCCFDPEKDGNGIETKRCLDQGMCGIGELAFYEKGMDRFSIDTMVPLMRIAEEKDVPVLLHVNEPVGHQYPGKTSCSFEHVYHLIGRFPKNKIVLAHWGGGIFFFNLLKKEFKKTFENVYVDTAASPFLYDPAIYRIALDIIGPTKILFGSDYPLILPRRYFEEMEKAGVSEVDTRMICGENAAQLLKMSRG